MTPTKRHPEAKRPAWTRGRRRRSSSKPRIRLGASSTLTRHWPWWWGRQGASCWATAQFGGRCAISTCTPPVRPFGRLRCCTGSSPSRRSPARWPARRNPAAAAGVMEVALRYRGVSFEIVYGVYGPTVPLIALMAVAAGISAMRENWLQLGVSIAIIAVASVSTFFGPLGAWRLTGLGCCLVLLAYAAALVVEQRRT